MTTALSRAGALLALAFLILVALASPVSATIHNHSLDRADGRLTIGGQEVKPGSWPCPFDLTLDGTINDGATTDNIAGTLAGSREWAIAPFGTWVLTVSGTASGTDAGDYSPATGTFTGMSFPSVAFTVRNLNVVTCTPTTTVCSGTFSLLMSGFNYNGSTLPFTNSGEGLAVNAVGDVTARGACAIPFSLFVAVGADVFLSDDPTTDYGNDGFAENGALFLTP
ncbi:MAG TPA: hypothetical protein VF228_01720 [Iamia sp.]